MPYGRSVCKSSQEMETTLADLVRLYKGKAGEGNGIVCFADEGVSATFILDAQTYSKVEHSGSAEQLAILQEILNGRNGEVIPLDVQEICNRIRPTEKDCRPQ